MIPLTHLVTSLETSEKLKLAGCPQDTLFYWVSRAIDWGKSDEYKLVSSDYRSNASLVTAKEYGFAAYTETELGVLLRNCVPDYNKLIIRDQKILHQQVMIEQAWSNENQIEDLASIILYLIEHKLVDVKSLKLEV